MEERVSDISDGINNRGSLRSENGPEIMGKRDSWPIVLDRTELWIH